MITLKIDNGDCDLEFIPQDDRIEMYITSNNEYVADITVQKDELPELIDFLQKRLSEME